MWVMTKYFSFILLLILILLQTVNIHGQIDTCVDNPWAPGCSTSDPIAEQAATDTATMNDPSASESDVAAAAQNVTAN